MAKIVLGVATSHSPLLSTPWDQWGVHAQRDLKNPRLLGPDGVQRPYAEQLELAPPTMPGELTPEKWQARWEACQKAIAHLAETVEKAAPDVIVAIGDDQHELYHEDNFPAISVYWGEQVSNIPRHSNGSVTAWAYQGEAPMHLPGQPGLGLHLIESLMDESFDITNSQKFPEGQGIPHAWGFLQRRILNDRPIPMVPLLLNTYYEPNQPRVGRCYDLGEAVRRAVESWDSDARVAVMASGGLSHFMVLEEFDQAVLNAMQENDRETLTSIPEKMFKTGTSETKNWIAASAALSELQMKVVDYVPCYRTPAGTGCGMAFAEWA